MGKHDGRNKRKAKNHQNQSNQQHKRNRNKHHNRRKLESDEGEMMREMENALLDQTARIIKEIMEVIKTRQARTSNSSEPRRQRERGLERPMDMLRDTVRAALNSESKDPPPQPTVPTRGEETNVNMNIQRTRQAPEVNIATTENSRVSFQGGNQMYPGLGNRFNRRNNQMPRPPRQNSQPIAQNTYAPTRGPGGRMEAPRDNVVVGSQALQYAARVANRVRSQGNQATQRANPAAHGNVPSTRGPVMSAPRAPVAVSARPAPVAAPARPVAPPPAPRAPVAAPARPMAPAAPAAPVAMAA